MIQKKLLEFNLFTVGDSSDINTWSGLPYFFSKSLTNTGIKLNRINILPKEKLVLRVYLRFVYKLINFKQKMFKEKFDYDPYRDKIVKYFAEKAIRIACRRYNHANLNIFLTFSFSSHKFSRVPVVHYCDQSYEHYLNDTEKKINKRDLYFIDIERHNLENAAHIFSTNKNCATFLSDHYKLKDVTYLAGGIKFESFDVEAENKILAAKKQNKDILFIGRGAYKRGVDILIKAFNLFNRKNDNAYTLHLVGIGDDYTAGINGNIVRYGYLSKNSPSDLKTYYDLLKKARLFVMPMRNGPPPGVVKEAGLMYTPVIVTNIWHMDELIKNNVNGILVDRPDPWDFADRMDFLVKNEAIWEKLARQAHQIAKEKYPWDKVAHRFLDVCSAYLGSQPGTQRDLNI